MNLAVYTTYCGVPERSSFVPYELDHRYPHYFICNYGGFMTTPRGLGWNMVYMETESISNDPVVSTMQSKIPKVLPHKFKELEDYDYLLYIDDKLHINLENIEFIISEMKGANSPIAMRKHPSTDIQLKSGEYNVLFDFATSMYQWRYRQDWDRMIQYINQEVDSGYTMRSKEYHACGVILRDMRHPETVKINETWYEHILRCGIQDQISYHFCEQRFKNTYTLPEAILVG